MRSAPLELLQRIQKHNFEITPDFVKECFRYRGEIQLLDRHNDIITGHDYITKHRAAVDARLSHRGLDRLKNHLQSSVSEDNGPMSFAVHVNGKVLLVDSHVDVVRELLDANPDASGVLLSNGKISLKIGGRPKVRTPEKAVEELLKAMPEAKVVASAKTARISHVHQGMGASQ